MKNIISTSKILDIIRSKAGCIGGDNQKKDNAQKNKNGAEETQYITLTNNKTGEKIKIPTEEFKKMTRLEFVKKFGVPEEEANALTDEQFEEQKKAALAFFANLEENAEELAEKLGEGIKNAVEQMGEAMQNAVKQTEEEQHPTPVETPKELPEPPQEEQKPQEEPQVQEEPDDAPEITSLEQALMMGHTAKVKKFLAQGADANIIIQNVGSALFFACCQGNAETVQALIDAKADVNYRNELSGCTPLMMAAQTGNKAIVEILIKAGADINMPQVINGQPNGFNALKIAQNYGFTEIAEILKAASIK